MRQKKGAAIGGTCSAPFANCFCILKEAASYSALCPLAHDPNTGLHPLHLPAQPVRYTDNLVGIICTAHSLDTMKWFFEQMYNLGLQVEGTTQSWPSLMATLQITGSQPHERVTLRLQDKLDKFQRTYQTVYRYPDVGTAKAFCTLRSLVPRLAKDAVYYRSALHDLRCNITMIQRDLACKNYSTASWYPSLRRHLSKWGVDQVTLHELRRTSK